MTPARKGTQKKNKGYRKAKKTSAKSSVSMPAESVGVSNAATSDQLVSVDEIVAVKPKVAPASRSKKAAEKKFSAQDDWSDLLEESSILITTNTPDHAHVAALDVSTSPDTSDDDTSPTATATKSRTVDSKTAETTVLVIENHFESWNEKVEVYAISRFGASFSVSRDCRIGQLIALNIPSTVEVPMLQRTEDPMPIICLVQQCNEFVRDGRVAFHVGVVFVGIKFPASFDLNPQQCYRISGTNSDGLFRIQETDAQHKTRLHPRFRMRFEVTLLLIQKSDRTIFRTDGVTNDVGAGGISVITAMDAHVGDKIKVGCREIDFYGVAVVCNRRSLGGNDYLFHLKFAEAKFPIERLLMIPETPPDSLLM